MNILSLVSYKILPAQMGGQKAIDQFLQGLQKKQKLICITTKSNNPQLASYEVSNILTDSPTRYFNVFYFFTLKKIIKERNISHIIIEHPYYGWLVFLLKFYLNKKIIIRSHNIESLRFKSIGKPWWKLLWHYEKWAHQKADFSFFITRNDLEYAVENYKIQKSKCAVITYGFHFSKIPELKAKIDAKTFIQNKHNISVEDKILLFNGTLSYKANLTALDIILQQINNYLLNINFKYKIIICGKSLPEKYNSLENYPNIIYAGFVEDISKYYLATDVFINPVNEGGGIKTKIVEALGYNINLVTTKSGAIGIPEEITGNKMIVVDDNNWKSFADSIVQSNLSENLPDSFYNHFAWDNIIDRANNLLINLK